MLKKLKLPFYNQSIEEKCFMIWIDNNTGYNISKITIKYCRYIGIIYIDWPAQFLDLNNLIKNL